MVRDNYINPIITAIKSNIVCLFVVTTSINTFLLIFEVQIELLDVDTCCLVDK